MSAASAISTVWTVSPLICIPRIARACSSASCGPAANLTPPALPRPPALTWALTITGPPSCSAAARASSGVVTTTCRVTGTWYLPNSSLACHSNRSTRREVTHGERQGRKWGPPSERVHHAPCARLRRRRRTRCCAQLGRRSHHEQCGATPLLGANADVHRHGPERVGGRRSAAALQDRR